MYAYSPASVKIAGQVHTIGPCLSQGLEITLEREGQRRRRRWISLKEAEGVGHQDGDPSKCSFEFGDVSPGMWRIKVVKRSEPTFCWGEPAAQIGKPVPPALEADTVSVEVSDDDVTDILFKQSGYLMTVNTKQPLAVTMQMDERSQFPFELAKGENKLCMARLGVYNFEPAQPPCVLLSEDVSS